MHLLRICCVRCGDGVHTRSQPCSLLASGPGVGKDGGFPGSEVLTTRPAPNLEPRDPLAARGDLQTAKGVGGVGPESQRIRECLFFNQKSFLTSMLVYPLNVSPLNVTTLQTH